MTKKELEALVNVAEDQCEDQKAYLDAVLAAIGTIDGVYEQLPEEIQGWYDSNLTAYEKDEQLSDIPFSGGDKTKPKLNKKGVEEAEVVEDVADEEKENEGAEYTPMHAEDCKVGESYYHELTVEDEEGNESLEMYLCECLKVTKKYIVLKDEDGDEYELTPKTEVYIIEEESTTDPEPDPEPEGKSEETSSKYLTREEFDEVVTELKADFAELFQNMANTLKE